VEKSPSYQPPRLWPSIGIGVLLVIIVLSFAFVGRALLVLFGGVLLAVFLRGLGDLLSKYTRLSRRAGFVITILALLGIGVGGTWVLVPTIAEQVGEFVDTLPSLADEFEDYLQETALGREVQQRAETFFADNGEILAGATDVLGLSLTTAVYLLIIFFAGIYLSVNPAWYVRGVVSLVPPARRALARRALGAMGHTLRWYLIGRAASMLAMGVLTTLGMMVLGVPLAVLLGIIAGTLTFVPYAGPIAAAIPIALVALLESPALMVYALIYYTFIQSFEGFVITPVVQQRAVHLPPALTIAAELIMGVLFGVIGVIMSVPLAAALMVFVQIVYVEALLEGKKG
jgi:predicted PurR-regulated permease PerM